MKVLITALALVTLIASPTFAQRQYPGELDFNSNRLELTITRLDGTVVNVRYTAKEIGPNLFMVYWTEPNGNAVTHIQDFKHGTLYANITFRDRRLVQFSGTLRQVQ